jgi:perosamine synthetase
VGNSPSSKSELRCIPMFKVFLAPEAHLMPRLRDVLYSGQISEGPPVAEFEREFSQFIGWPHVISFYSGTAALHTALILAGVQPGDEVISTAMTAEPTNMVIRHAGAHIVWADVDSRNGNLRADAIEAKITERTRALMVVHYGGIPAPLNAIRAVAEKYGLPVIEDAAHALGARYGGRLLGCHSEFVMFSLQAIKHMTTVDGGMLACRQPEDACQGRLVRWFGIDRSGPRLEADISIVGYKYHMNNVNATIGLVQLEYIQPVIDRHIANGRYYDQALRDIPGLDLCVWDAEAEPSYWFYTVLVERRGDFIRHLEAHGVAASLVHKRNDLCTVFADSRCPLPSLDDFSRRVVHIPCGWWVSDEDREYVVDVIKQGW